MEKETGQIAAQRAMDDLRRGLGFAVPQPGGFTLFFPIESLDNQAFSSLPAGGRSVILTGARAEYLRLNGKSPAAVAADASALSHGQIRRLADPLAENGEGFDLSIRAAGEIEQLALVLAKHASLLPALLAVETKSDMGCQIVSAAEIRRHARNPVAEAVETARARLPIKGIENATVVSFRSPGDAGTHLALIAGDIAKAKTPLVRVHSSCVTGDILESLRCDCGDQLHLALESIAREGAGVLLYLHQEGRGIGIANKLKAYALQERGVDTYTANRMLGFEEDERDFSIAAAILKKLGVIRIKLLTNNPYKITSLKARGIVVTERVGLASSAGKHNHAYLNAKKQSGHLF